MANVLQTAEFTMMGLILMYGFCVCRSRETQETQLRIVDSDYTL